MISLSDPGKFAFYNRLKNIADKVHITYGARTKLFRSALDLEKSHVNDAYAMGALHPADRADPVLYTKKRRNNRILEKFYDAKFIDIRDGSKKSGAQLSCGRTRRWEPRRTEKNERIYRGEKVSKGRRTTRKQRYKIQPGTIIVYKGKWYRSKGVQHYGEYVTIEGQKKAFPVKNVIIIKQPFGWIKST